MNQVIQHNKLLFVLVCVLAGYMGQFVPQAMVPDNSLRIWFYDDDPNLKSYYESMDIFGNDEIVAIFFEPKGGELDNETIALVRAISERLDELENIDRVFSITTGKDVLVLMTVWWLKIWCPRGNLPMMS